MAHSRTVIFAALAGNTAIAVTKFAAAILTGSSAMMSEAIHSVVDTGNQLLLLNGLRRAAKPPTERHPLGYGLQLYFYTFVVAVLIFGVGAIVSVLHGVERIRNPEPIENAWVNYAVLAFGVIFEGAVWIVALKSFNEERAGRGWVEAVKSSKDPTVFTVLFEDTAALLGLLVALLGVFFSQVLDMPVLDGVASVGVGLILAATAFFLAAESQSLLTGEAAAPHTRAEIKAIAGAQPGVARVNELITMHFGPCDILVTLSLDFDDAMPAGEVERTVTRIEKAIKAAHPDVTRIFIEAQSFEGHWGTENPSPLAGEGGPTEQGRMRGR